MLNQSGTFGLVAPQEVGCFLEGVVKRGFTVFHSVNIFTELEVD